LRPRIPGSSRDCSLITSTFENVPYGVLTVAERS